MFKEKLKHLRKINNMSQEELANMLSVSRQAVSRWETGETMPDAETLVRLSEVFSVSIDSLLKKDAEPENIKQRPSQKEKTDLLYQITGICISLLSCVALIVLGVLSSVFPAVKIYSINGGTARMPKANLFTFLERHNLEWLFMLMIFIFALGIVLICNKKYNITDKIKNKGKSIYNQICSKR